MDRSSYPAISLLKMTWHNAYVARMPTRQIGLWQIPTTFHADAGPLQFALGVVFAFILAMVASLIGANLIGSVATSVGGALKNTNLTGAAKDLTSQITLFFVVIVIIGIISFVAILGFLASKAAEGKE